MTNMSPDKYVSKYKTDLLKLYSSIYSGIELDSFIRVDLKIPDLEKIAALLTIISHRLLDSKLIFNVHKIKVDTYDELAVDELYPIILCEEEVRKGTLVRDGNFYLAKDCQTFQSIPKYKKYIKSS